MDDLVKRLRSRAWEDRQHRQLREEAADEIERLTAERDDLRRDAARYQWLRLADNSESIKQSSGEYDDFCEWLPTDVDLDAAIDAAMKVGEA